MLNQMRKWLRTTPAITNPIQCQQAPMLQVIIIGIALLIILLIGATAISNSIDAGGLISLVISLGLAVISLQILRRGHFNIAVALLVSLILLPDLAVFTRLGFNAYWATFFALSIPIILSGLLGNLRMLWATIILIIGLFSWIMITTISNPQFFQQLEPISDSNAERITIIAQWIALCVQMLFIGICFAVFGQTPQRSILLGLDRQKELEQLRAQQEQVIESRTSDLRQSLVTVEQREQELARTLADLHASKEIISAISVPTIPVLPGILLVPIVGHLDSQRADAMTTNTLRAIEQQHSHATIFDITGVEVVDTNVAQVLLRTASAANLLGTQIIMVGIRPEVAQTMVALGIDMSMFTTYSDLRSALTELLLREGWVRSNGGE